ncbi:hypothetical protein C8C83_3344 [Flavobacterium sp. 90]|uniref:hypothetical protein n=1 Tax=unclassified Flavobacterium TaxID=196869 RepID=UPI000EAE3100|nr:MULTISPECIES: hypothetical protein [unclassified Flavobacterium]RKR11604.1 hypothetical protein C8C82_3655 [Flavobacterium sp. 81]TCK55385.1 hypothetical protein C8C83_3344 [Flavobacterium sp. 90]
MLKTILCLSLSSTIVVNGQHKISKTKPIGLENNKPQERTYAKFDLSKRINSYPFNKASQIKIISYNLNSDGMTRVSSETYDKETGKTVTNLEYNIGIELPRNNLDSLSLENVTQIKILNLSQIEKLSDILYNTCSRLNINCSEIIRGCYLPRNAILFFDENGKVFEYLEICFECKTKETFGKIENLDLSDYMYNDLEKYFNNLGIKTKYEPLASAFK